MLEYLKFHEHPVIENYTFEKIPRVSVFCGKNNSGKSTILEEVINENSKFARRGFSFSESEINNLKTNIINGKKWGDDRNLNAILKNLADQLAINYQVAYHDESGIFSADLDAAIRKDSRLVKWHYDSHLAVLQFDQKTKTPIPMVLIPAKRRIDYEKSISTGAGQASDGGNLINTLFSMKNKVSDDPLKVTYEAIKTSFRGITSDIDFDIVVKDNNVINLYFSNPSGQWVRSDKCGLGFRDLLLMLYYSLAENNEVVCIEEPESHLHPEMQKKFMDTVVNKSNRQFIFSTHSNVFIRSPVVDQVFMTEIRNGKITIKDETSKAFLLDSLGYSVSDNLVSDLIILTEGPSDGPVIEEFLSRFGVTDNRVIKVWPMGGDVMNQLDLSVITEKGKCVAVIDSDPGSAAVRDLFIKNCQKSSIPVHRLERYSIENYLDLSAMKEVLPQIKTKEEFTLNHHEKVESQIGYNIKRNNRLIARKTSTKSIEESDFMQFIAVVRNMLSA